MKLQGRENHCQEIFCSPEDNRKEIPHGGEITMWEKIEWTEWEESDGGLQFLEAQK